MKITKFISLALVMAVSAFSMTSCSDDEEDETVTDVRMQAVGEYTSTIELYEEDESGNLTEFRTHLTESDRDLGTSTVSLSGDNGINLYVDGGKIAISKIKGASNGFVGDIESLTVMSGYKTEGYKGASLSSTGSTTEKYDAVYFSDKKELSVYFRVVNSTTIMLIRSVKK